jgi:hypothetical protein
MIEKRSFYHPILLSSYHPKYSRQDAPGAGASYYMEYGSRFPLEPCET